MMAISDGYAALPQPVADLRQRIARYLAVENGDSKARRLLQDATLLLEMLEQEKAYYWARIRQVLDDIDRGRSDGK